MPRLTKQLLDETPFPVAGQMFVRDIELPGFALRVTQGRKSFILEKRIRGRMRRLTIRHYGSLTGRIGCLRRCSLLYAHTQHIPRTSENVARLLAWDTDMGRSWQP